MNYPRLHVQDQRCFRSFIHCSFHESWPHQQTVQTATNPASAPRGPKLERPNINIGLTVEEWNIFTRRWHIFRSESEIDEPSATSQLFQCAKTELGDSLLNPRSLLEKIVTRSLEGGSIGPSPFYFRHNSSD